MNDRGHRAQQATPALPRAAAVRAVLSPHGEEIIRACAPAVLGPLLPAEHAARDAALDAGMASLDEYLAHLSLPLQKEARFLLGVLALLPVRVLLLGTWSRWSAIVPERIEAFLGRARDSRFLVLRRTHAFLQSMVVIAWFDLPAAWNEVGYPGPPIERPTRPGAQP
jgi:hypothetical protein